MRYGYYFVHNPPRYHNHRLRCEVLDFAWGVGYVYYGDLQGKVVTGKTFSCAPEGLAVSQDQLWLQSREV